MFSMFMGKIWTLVFCQVQKLFSGFFAVLHVCMVRVSPVYDFFFF